MDWLGIGTGIIRGLLTVYGVFTLFSAGYTMTERRGHGQPGNGDEWWEAARGALCCLFGASDVIPTLLNSITF